MKATKFGIDFTTFWWALNQPDFTMIDGEFHLVVEAAMLVATGAAFLTQYKKQQAKEKGTTIFIDDAETNNLLIFRYNTKSLRW